MCFAGAVSDSLQIHGSTTDGLAQGCVCEGDVSGTPSGDGAAPLKWTDPPSHTAPPVPDAAATQVTEVGNSDVPIVDVSAAAGVVAVETMTGAPHADSTAMLSNAVLSFPVTDPEVRSAESEAHDPSPTDVNNHELAPGCDTEGCAGGSHSNAGAALLDKIVPPLIATAPEDQIAAAEQRADGSSPTCVTELPYDRAPSYDGTATKQSGSPPSPVAAPEVDGAAADDVEAPTTNVLPTDGTAPPQTNPPATSAAMPEVDVPLDHSNRVVTETVPATGGTAPPLYCLPHLETHSLHGQLVVDVPANMNNHILPDGLYTAIHLVFVMIFQHTKAPLPVFMPFRDFVRRDVLRGPEARNVQAKTDGEKAPVMVANKAATRTASSPALSRAEGISKIRRAMFKVCFLADVSPSPIILKRLYPVTP